MLKSALNVAIDLHKLENGMPQRQRRIAAQRAWDWHLTGEETSSVELVLPDC